MILLMAISRRLYHPYLFAFGVLYYLVTPIFVLKFGVIEGMPGVNLLNKYDVDPYFHTYLVIAIIFLISFLLGSYLPLNFKKKHQRHTFSHSIGAKDIFCVSIPFALFGQYVIFNARNSLFKGYTIDYDIELMGAIATCNSIFLVLYLYIVQLPKSPYRIWFRCLLFEFSLVLLGLGSRMYVLIIVIALVLYYMSINKVKARKIIYIATFSTLFFLIVGIVRLSSTDISLDALLYIGCAEPLFTWISAISYFNYNDITMISFPSNFISTFINFIPTLFLPNKSTLIVPLSGEFDAPLGATNLMISMLDNFGIIGSAIMLFCGGALLTCIRYNFKSKLGNAYYFCLCGIIPFQLFRDNLSIVNKMIFFNFLLLPIALLGIIKLLKANMNHSSFNV